ncbi:acyl carrier protein [Streptomyces phaeochromogenes]|uniref:acyl carrier protein n=1 Tax=Streptomyces phaeochromogenes TaxID=1923 RepID=UPI003718FF99
MLTAGFQVPADRIAPDSTLDDLGLDSLATASPAGHVPLRTPCGSSRRTVASCGAGGVS